MLPKLPQVVLEAHPGTLIPVLDLGKVELYLREDEWGLKKYPPSCHLDVRIGTWEIDGVLLAVLLARFNHSDPATFESWINVAEPAGVRLIQALEPQKHLNVNIVTERFARAFRVPNPLRLDAGQLVKQLRRHYAWSLEQYEAAQRRLARMYPSPVKLWWHMMEMADARP